MSRPRILARGERSTNQEDCESGNYRPMADVTAISGAFPANLHLPRSHVIVRSIVHAFTESGGGSAPVNERHDIGKRCHRWYLAVVVRVGRTACGTHR